MKRNNSGIGLSGEIEQVITNLLRTTKALLEALTQWSTLQANSSDIFEIHDTLEKQFFLVSHTFEDASIIMSDLQWIPKQLRESISLAMSEQPSPSVLDQHLPRIRDVIVRLLHGLKAKQAQYRERDRGRSATMENWNREVPLAALNRHSGSQRPMYPPNNPSSPPLLPHLPLSPRMVPSNNDHEHWSGGMPRPVYPPNDLSSRIMPRNGSMSARSQSPSLPAVMATPPSRSTSTKQTQRLSTSPTPPIKFPSPPKADPPPSFDESDPNTASALAALKRQENLARRSSVRRASMFRTNTEYTPRGKSTSIPESDEPGDIPPVPAIPVEETPEMETVEEHQEEEVQGITLFLKFNKEVKKVTFNGEITMAALNMLFLESFNSLSHQTDFAEIYIRDPAVGIDYELTDLKEVKNKTVLSLNRTEETKEFKKEWITDITALLNKELNETRRVFKEEIDGIKEKMNEQVKEKPLDEDWVDKMTSSIIASLGQSKMIEDKEESDEDDQIEPTNEVIITEIPSVVREQLESQRLEIEQLRRDVSVLRQLDREMKDETTAIVKEIKTKAAEVAIKQKEDLLKMKPSHARSLLEEGKSLLLTKSEKITSRLEELQDTIDELKLDVTQRKCRPSEIQMTHCARERQSLAEQIDDFSKYINQVKPRWKKIWEEELQTIVKEQQLFKDQEYLLSDMKDDLDALLEVYVHLEKICAYQASAKPVVREFIVNPVQDGQGMASVFKQMQSIDVDHNRRLRAMEQAEKMRQRELANRIDDFEHELSTFVDTKKLKKTGGAMEIDRLRKQKDEEMIKAMYEAKKAQAADGTDDAPEE